jgi:hypothetical protein
MAMLVATLSVDCADTDKISVWENVFEFRVGSIWHTATYVFTPTAVLAAPFVTAV